MRVCEARVDLEVFKKKEKVKSKITANFFLLQLQLQQVLQQLLQKQQIYFGPLQYSGNPGAHSLDAHLHFFCSFSVPILHRQSDTLPENGLKIGVRVLFSALWSVQSSQRSSSFTVEASPRHDAS